MQVQIQLVPNVETGYIPDMVLRVQALNQNFLSVFMGICHDLIGQAAHPVQFIDLHITQPAVHEIGQGAFQAAHLQFRPGLVPPDPLNPFSRHILFQRLHKQPGLAGLPGKFDHLIFRQLPLLKLGIQKALHQPVDLRP